MTRIVIGRTTRVCALVVLVCAAMVLMCGCWDAYELDSLLIVLGVSFDAASTPDKVDIGVQIGKNMREASGSGGVTTENSAVLFRAEDASISSGFIDIEKNSSHKLLVNHIEVFLFGEEIAAQGIKKYMDAPLRNPGVRQDVPLVVVAGRAVDALSENLEGNSIAGNYFDDLFHGLARKSKYYQVRVLDFTLALLRKDSASVIPMIQVYTTDRGYQQVKMIGMAVFKEDKMVGKLDLDQMQGYIWANGDLGMDYITVDCQLGQAAFSVEKLDCVQRVAVENGEVRVCFDVRADVSLLELVWPEAMDTEAMKESLSNVLNDTVRMKILDSFSAAQALDADIYAVGERLYRFHPGQWREVADEWSEYYQNAQVDVQVNAKIRSYGNMLGVA